MTGAMMMAPTRAWSEGGRGHHKGGGGGGAHCFLNGTLILTPEGERPIEQLRIGDLVSTVAGTAKPIKWMARRRFDRSEKASWDEAFVPVKIARGAFNGESPHSDLYVSGKHCFLINGLLVPAGDLVNGISITRLSSAEVDVLDYWHIELEDHDVILANGAPAETLEGNANRMDFDNFDEYVALYGPTLTIQIPYARVVTRNKRREALRSYLRGALAPIHDRRQPLEIIQDELAQQAQRRLAA